MGLEGQTTKADQAPRLFWGKRSGQADQTPRFSWGRRSDTRKQDADAFCYAAHWDTEAKEFGRGANTNYLQHLLRVGQHSD